MTGRAKSGDHADVYDIVFVGSGLSSTFGLIRLLEQLTDEPPEVAWRILVTEQANQFFTGIPYGERSGATSLIITPLEEFLPAEQLADFTAWLNTAPDSIFDEFIARGGHRSNDWLRRAATARKSGNWNHLHVPRYLWGHYITELLESRIAAAASAGAARVVLRRAEVTAVEADPAGGYRIETNSHTTSTDTTAKTVAAKTVAAKTVAAKTVAAKVVLAIGMPPTRRLFAQAPVGQVPEAQRASESKTLLIEEPYEPDLDTTMDTIAATLAAASRSAGGRVGEQPHIAVIGANAGALEVLYQLDNFEAIRARAPRVTVLSPQGRLPERYQAKAAPQFRPTHLTSLADGQTVLANDILKCVELDVVDARAAGFEIGDSLPPISASVGSLLKQLSPSELRIFASHPGVEIGRLQRRAGAEYCDAADDLEANNQLSILRGSYVGLTPTDDGRLAPMISTGDNLTVTLDPADVVINCSGSAGLQRPNQSALINNLLESGLCSATDSGHGIRVDDHFQAAPGLFVNGPLLAGNVVAGQGIWHVEHCGRIINFSTQLARLLVT